MEFKEQIAQYLSGHAGKKAERQTENALLRDTSFLVSFIEEIEQRLCNAPSDFANAVMSLIPNSPVKAIPLMSRKLCAAVCFCSAAAIMLITLSGYDREMIDFISTQAHRLGEWIALS